MARFTIAGNLHAQQHMRIVLLRLTACLLLIALLGAGELLRFSLWPLSLQSNTVEFSIRPGSSLRAATQEMIDSGVQMPYMTFNLLARISGNAGMIKAGPYEIRSGATGWQLLEKLTRGEFNMAEITFIEGWTFRQIRAAIRMHPSMRHDSSAMHEGEIMSRLGMTGMPAEGWFFPDTYRFPKGESDLVILGNAMNAMKRILESSWPNRKAGIPLRSPYEALILASIVEKETGRPDERSLIAAVFQNRLRIGMRLQTDPTVIYGLGEKFDGNLRRQHLMMEGPFNSYLRPGLPPHPISSPGKQAIEATLQPAATDALYFVARGDGSSEFSRNLSQHNLAVRRFQLKN